MVIRMMEEESEAYRYNVQSGIDCRRTFKFLVEDETSQPGGSDDVSNL
jgi:hypothetical protein